MFGKGGLFFTLARVSSCDRLAVPVPEVDG